MKTFVKKRYKLWIKKQVLPWISGMPMMTLGILSATFGLKGFLLPNGFIDGGVMGVSLLIHNLFGFSLSWLVIIINAPFIILGFSQVSKSFGFKTLIAILGLSFALAFCHFPSITQDKLLVSVFGGVFLGTGIGLAIRGGSVIDGTEVLALYINKKWGISLGDVILCLNIVIFSITAYVLNLETALYSILAYFSASKMVDFIVQGIEEYLGITIISPNKSKDIQQMIIHKLGRGVTIYKGERGFGSRGHTQDMDIIFTVMTRLELPRLQSELDRIDRQAFIVEQPIRNIRGGVVKKRATAHL